MRRVDVRDAKRQSEMSGELVEAGDDFEERPGGWTDVFADPR